MSSEAGIRQRRSQEGDDEGTEVGNNSGSEDRREDRPDEKQQGDAEKGAEQGPPQPVGFWHPALKHVRHEAMWKWLLTTVVLMCFILSVLSICAFGLVA